MENYSNDLQVSGGFIAGNMAWGSVTVSVTPNVVSSVTVSGLSLTGAGTMDVFITPQSTVPNNVQSQGVNNITNGASFQINIYRTTDVDTNVHWFAIRSAT